jgi:hypothetical protein
MLDVFADAEPTANFDSHDCDGLAMRTPSWQFTLGVPIHDGRAEEDQCTVEM